MSKGGGSSAKILPNMSPAILEAGSLKSRAALFAALGDETRLSVLSRLAAGRAQSIARLTEGTHLTRQAVTKHLKVLEDAGMLTRQKEGRESLYALEPKSLADLRDYLDLVSRQWDEALARLKAFVED